MPSPADMLSRFHHVQAGAELINEAHAANVQEAIDGAKIDALRSSEAGTAPVKFTEALEMLVRGSDRHSFINVIRWAKEFFGGNRSRVAEADVKVSRFASLLFQREAERNLQAVEVPVERANPLAYAASVAYQQHLAAMPQAPQVAVQSAAVMVSPITGLPIGLMGIHF